MNDIMSFPVSNSYLCVFPHVMFICEHNYNMIYSYLSFTNHVSGCHVDVSGWHIDVSGWHVDVSGWHVDVSGWHVDEIVSVSN
jgi:uncharacterized membrane protein